MAKFPATIEPLNDRESNFISRFVETGDGLNSARHAGYPESTALAWRSRLLASAHIAWSVAIATRKRIAEHAPMALRTLAELAEHAESEKVKLEAARSLLAIGGYVAPRAAADKPQADKPLHEKSTGELQELATRLEDELAGRAKPLRGATLAPDEAQAADVIG